MLRKAQILSNHCNKVEIRHKQSGNVLAFEVISNGRNLKNRCHWVRHIQEGKSLYMGHIFNGEFLPAKEGKAGVAMDTPVGKVWEAFWERIVEGWVMPSGWEVNFVQGFPAKAKGHIKRRK